MKADLTNTYSVVDVFGLVVLVGKMYFMAMWDERWRQTNCKVRVCTDNQNVRVEKQTAGRIQSREMSYNLLWSCVKPNNLFKAVWLCVVQTKRCVTVDMNRGV